MTNTGGPRCPNHLVTLDRTNTKGIGICPISGARFEYKADDLDKKRHLKLDVFGNVKEGQKYVITPLDGVGG